MHLDEFPEMMEVKHVAEYLGIHRVTAAPLMKRKDFPSVVVGRRRFVYRDAFRQWLMQQKKAS
jgi:excisionase family DNA binding protein